MLETEEFAQSLGLGAADRNFSLLLVIHAQLIGALEPRHNFLDAVDVHQVGAVGAPEKIRVESFQQFLQGPAVGLSLHPVDAGGHYA